MKHRNVHRVVVLAALAACRTFGGAFDDDSSPDSCSALGCPVPDNCSAPACPPANTWTMIPALPAGTPPTVRAGKHARLAWDSTRHVFLLAGGDRYGSDAGQPAVEAVDPQTGLATEISPTCPPAPQVMPNFPDNVVWVYDTKRDRAVMMPGFFFSAGDRALTVCGRDATTDLEVVHGGLIFDPSATSNWWSKAPWPTSPLGVGSDATGPTFGAYHAPTDSIYTIKKDGAWGSNVQILDLATNTWTRLKMGETLPSGSAEREALRNANAYRSQPAIADGMLYVISARADHSSLIRFDIATELAMRDRPDGAPLQSWEQVIPMPDGYVSAPDDTESCLVHDPKANVLLHIRHPSTTGTVTHLDIFDIATGQWETRPVPVLDEPVKGGNCAYDPTSESLMIWGRKANGVDGYPMYHYRYVKVP